MTTRCATAVEANLLTSIRLVRAAVPHMRPAGWGRIVLLTSVAIKEPIPDLAASSAARTGLWAWAKSAASDLIDDAITLNVLAPGLHDTDRVRALGHTGPRATRQTSAGSPRSCARSTRGSCRASRSRSTAPVRLGSCDPRGPAEGARRRRNT